jgi:chemotaxis methyl-accepting protein methylase
MKKLKHSKKGVNLMENQKSLTLLEKTSQRLAETSTETIELYEKYLLDQVTWRDLAKNMTKLRSSISAYYAAGGK